MTAAKEGLTRFTLDDVPSGASVLALATFRLSRLLKSHVTEVVSQDADIGLVSWRVLVGLSHADQATQKELVAFTSTEQAQLSRVLANMEQRRLITSKALSSDGRAKVFRMTERGRAKFNALFPRVKNLTDAMDAALAPGERAEFLQMCDRIANAAEMAKKEQSRPKEGRQTKSQMEGMK